MNIEKLEQLFEKHNDEFLKFDRIESPKYSNRPDLSAFLLLAELCQDTGDIIGAAEHDVIYLSTKMEDILPVITEEHIVYLTRCGVMLSEFDCLSMFT